MIKKVLFIGISNKPGCTPLQSGTKSGNMIDQIISRLDAKCYKTNLVNSPPLDEKGKLRYPTQSEMDDGYKDLQELIKTINPDVCVLLGEKTSKYLADKLVSISIKHPSYIAVYKRKYQEEYVKDSVKNISIFIGTFKEDHIERK